MVASSNMAVNLSMMTSAGRRFERRSAPSSADSRPYPISHPGPVAGDCDHGSESVGDAATHRGPSFGRFLPETRPGFGPGLFPELPDFLNRSKWRAQMARTATIGHNIKSNGSAANGQLRQFIEPSFS